MDERHTYEKPQLVDYGSGSDRGLPGRHRGDALMPSGHLGEFTFGKSINNSLIQCTSR